MKFFFKIGATLLYFLFVHVSFFSQTKCGSYNSTEEFLLTKKTKSYHSFFPQSPLDYSKLSFTSDTFIKDIARTSQKIYTVRPLLKTRNWLNLSNQKISSDNLFGAMLESSYASKFFSTASLIAGKSSFPDYIDSIIRPKSIIPGYGIAYGKNNNYSFQNFSFNLAYTPNNIFAFSVGRGTHFWGDGYRSLILGNNTSPYYYGAVTANVKNFKYKTLFAWLKDASQFDGSKKSLQNKYATFHALSWNISKRFNFTLFESIVWQGTDSNRTRGYDVNYLNPVVFFRPVEYSIGSSDNAFLGAAIKILPFKNQVLYGQLVLDEFLKSAIYARNGWWGNKYGIQAGLKSYNLFTVKNLFLNTEFNLVRPYTYSHGSVQQNYSHLGTPLAHPFGANFMESVNFVSYSLLKTKEFETSKQTFPYITFTAQLVIAQYGKDIGANNYGKNIFSPYTTRVADYNNTIGQGATTNFYYGSFSASYLIWYKYNLNAQLGVAYRKEGVTSTPYLLLSVYTALSNLFEDQ